MSLLSICTTACARMTLAQPGTIVGNTTDKIAPLLLALAREGGKQLSRRVAWKKLTKEHTFTTTATAAQSSGLASDLDWIIPETMFDRTLSRRVNGPVDAGEWQAIQASLHTQVFPAFRIRGTSLLITPTPSAGNTVAYEYISTKWCTTSDGLTEQTTWTADNDVALLDEELHILNLIWMWKRAQGLSFMEDLANFERQVSQASMREGVRPRISTDGPWRGRRRGADAIAGATPNMIVTEGGDQIIWD